MPCEGGMVGDAQKRQVVHARMLATAKQLCKVGETSESQTFQLLSFIIITYNQSQSA